MNHDKVRRKDLWKFNHLLDLNHDFIDKIQAHIRKIQKKLDKKNRRSS